MSHRFFVETPVQSPRVSLLGGEARHLARVMRLGVGDEVELFDGSGREFTARIEAVGRDEVELSVLEQREIDRELPFSLVLAVALPKGDRQKWLVEKLVELGVTELVPLETARGVAQPGPQAVERLRRGVIEAGKQCGRNRLMRIGPPRGLEEFAREASARKEFAEVRLLLHPDPPSARGIGLLPVPRASVAAMVGPEGGFTPEELALAERHGWRRVSLGPRILRIETAAIALAAALAIGKED